MHGKITERVSASATDGEWVRTGKCTPNNNCVELRFGGDVVTVRDSKNVDSAVLTFHRDQWNIFLGRHVG
ncbi:DUF397 domain-containing protein [Actinophytocola sp.]|uniref:DUF397 domain-containing protein n=1 Tax=Actinophytocola sp. TaxID=1872138 RepID=UPI002ED15DA0